MLLASQKMANGEAKSDVGYWALVKLGTQCWHSKSGGWKHLQGTKPIRREAALVAKKYSRNDRGDSAFPPNPKPIGPTACDPESGQLGLCVWLHKSVHER
jgi:hypothetical protein